MTPDTEEIRASIIGGIGGGIVLGVVLQFTTPLLPAMATVYQVSAPTLVVGWIAHLFNSVIFGVVFAGLVTRYIDQYISTVLMLTTRSEAAKNVLMPLTDSLGMALVVTIAMGLIYGLAVGLGFGVLLVPLFAAVAQFPFLDGTLLLGYALFGVTLGGTYGKLVMG